MIKHMVCLSGTFCDKQLWQSQVNVLKDSYDFIFPDISKYNKIDELVGNMLNELPEKFSLMGMSAGAVVAFEILRQAPQRVEKLCVIAGNPSGITDELKQRFDEQITMVEKNGIDSFFNNFLLPISLSEKNAENDNIKNRIVAMAKRVGFDVFKQQISVLKSRGNAMNWLKDLKIPVLAVCGQEDKICPPKLHQQIINLVDNGTLIILPETGHYINFENEQGLNESLINFF